MRRKHYFSWIDSSIFLAHDEFVYARREQGRTWTGFRDACSRVKSTLGSASGVSLSAAADKPPEKPNAAGARGHPRAASLSVASAGIGSLMNVDPETKVIYLVKSYPRPT